MSETQTTISPLPKGTRRLNLGNCPGHQPPISQLVEIQRLLMEEMREAKGKPMARAVVARAWKELETLKREMRMQPKPRPVDVVALQKQKLKRQRSAMLNVEAIEVQPAP
jgi:hypothetical protein